MSSFTLFSTLAVKAALEETVLPSFGRTIATTFDPTSVLAARIADGEPFDVIIATDEFLAETAATGLTQAAVPLASTGIGVAILSGGHRPDIGSIQALERTLIQARSVAYSRTGASGIYFASLLDQLGIAAAVNARATILPKGFTAEALIDGRADLAIQQTSELAAVSGAELLGELPPQVQQRTGFGVAIATTTGKREVSADFIRHLQRPAATAAFRRYGLSVSPE